MVCRYNTCVTRDTLLHTGESCSRVVLALPRSSERARTARTRSATSAWALGRLAQSTHERVPLAPPPDSRLPACLILWFGTHILCLSFSSLSCSHSRIALSADRCRNTNNGGYAPRFYFFGWSAAACLPKLSFPCCWSSESISHESNQRSSPLFFCLPETDFLQQAIGPLYKYASGGGHIYFRSAIRKPVTPRVPLFPAIGFLPPWP